MCVCVGVCASVCVCASVYVYGGNGRWAGERHDTTLAGPESRAQPAQPFVASGVPSGAVTTPVRATSAYQRALALGVRLPVG